jgi:ATP-dependent RNA helicase DDX35
VADYVQAAVQTVVDLHREDVPGDVLVFLTGQEEVEAAVKLLEEEARKLARSRLKYHLVPAAMYAGRQFVHGLRMTNGLDQVEMVWIAM